MTEKSPKSSRRVIFGGFFVIMVGVAIALTQSGQHGQLTEWFSETFGGGE